MGWIANRQHVQEERRGQGRWWDKETYNRLNYICIIMAQILKLSLKTVSHIENPDKRGGSLRTKEERGHILKLQFFSLERAVLHWLPALQMS